VLLPDVNVLVAAHREAVPRHEEARGWLVSALAGGEAVALCLPVVSGLIRVATSPRVFAPPSTLDEVFIFVTHLAAHPSTVWVNPGRQHLQLLEELCLGGDARGDLVSDAVIAALAVEAGATVITYDRDFARFGGVRWRTPTAGARPAGSHNTARRTRRGGRW
jgi:toxin-antitoxin system PIN domain toxin